MKLADATWDPGPGRLAHMLAEPITVPPSSVATDVRPGGGVIPAAGRRGSE
jgi:hypothetical protein